MSDPSALSHLLTKAIRTRRESRSTNGSRRDASSELNAPDVSTKLSELVKRGASGEFICATSSLEIHVYLQRGRIAWATDSKHPFAFAKHLQETADVDEGTFKEVVDTCRRDRLPIGETLVQWNLVSWEQVRASLCHQIRLAFEELLLARGGHTLFLDRAYSDYNPKLTFDVEEFMPRASSDGDHDARPAGDDWGGKAGFARQLRESIEGLEWVEVIEGETLADSDPGGREMRTPSCVLRSSIHDGADFVAVRSSEASLVGVTATETGRSLWCQLEADSAFGAVVSTLWAITSMGRNMGPASTPMPGALTPFASRGDDGDMEREVAAFLRSAPDVRAAVVLDDEPTPLIGFALPRVGADRLLELAFKRRECLSCPLLMGKGQKDSLGSVGFNLKTMASGEGDVWCFGAELGTDRTLWLFLERSCPQGLGWAYLSTLYRSLSHLPLRAEP